MTFSAKVIPYNFVGTIEFGLKTHKQQPHEEMYRDRAWPQGRKMELLQCAVVGSEQPLVHSLQPVLQSVETLMAPSEQPVVHVVQPLMQSAVQTVVQKQHNVQAATEQAPRIVMMWERVGCGTGTFVMADDNSSHLQQWCTKLIIRDTERKGFCKWCNQWLLQSWHQPWHQCYIHHRGDFGSVNGNSGKLPHFTEFPMW